MHAEAHILIAGIGNPYAVLDTTNRRMLMILRDGASMAEIAGRLALSPSITRARLSRLRAASLIDDADPPVPAVLVAHADEAVDVVKDAQRMGAALADVVYDAWPDIEREYSVLDSRRYFSLVDVGLIVVAARILDLDLLDAFARDGGILPAPPRRPAPGRTADRYYLWMTAGLREWRGRYGGGGSPLPWPDWALHTFGRFGVDATARQRRAGLETAALHVAEDADITSPGELAARLRVPCIPPADAKHWSLVCRGVTVRLVDLYRGRTTELHQLHERLHPRGRSTFSEFVCWHVHLATGFAIDALVERGTFPLPPDGFQMAVWFQPDEASDFLRDPDHTMTYRT